ncbi:hypothetical protein CO178_02410 [candidate division WWE3 bacterium CG_4_9_14_3_um_filter_34_6]|uniref:NIF system FeS cluster assembly NifU N-terminal domain-containing protein n=1 Tax=candidate division WWE3 bacterium CG_4_9_14_3_um_filter_34_6 TaxID=1975079 RepID=A0A2M7X2A0_UNCKA|nr:MAG: hypothetical protein CO178_02410 [candidate division WWE3 bacterium CG_4_9_14_3_um_filter_34_6]
MDNLYKEDFLYYYRNQDNKRNLSGKTHIGESSNVSCGDSIKVELVVKNGNIVDVGYSSDGCMVSEVSASIMSEKLIGMKLAEVQNLSLQEYLNIVRLDLTVSREKCAMVFYDALTSVKKVKNVKN